MKEWKKNSEGLSVENSNPKIKHETLWNDYKAGGLKNVNIPNKIIALRCFWIRRLYDNCFHKWKLIPLYLIEKSFGSSFKFHWNLLFKSNKTNFFPFFHREIFRNGKYCCTCKLFCTCYDNWNTFLHSLSISVVKCDDPDR